MINLWGVYTNYSQVLFMLSYLMWTPLGKDLKFWSNVVYKLLFLVKHSTGKEKSKKLRYAYASWDQLKRTDEESLERLDAGASDQSKPKSCKTVKKEKGWTRRKYYWYFNGHDRAKITNLWKLLKCVFSSVFSFWKQQQSFISLLNKFYKKDDRGNWGTKTQEIFGFI